MILDASACDDDYWVHKPSILELEDGWACVVGEGIISHTRIERIYMEMTWVSVGPHKPGDSLPLLSARLAFTSPAVEHHHPLSGTSYTA